ncbi:hypothetical protein PybrP1_003854 [[Pythium] brassicae (nom. inval.)]|nr:hypothetical protein PybrP1_003854 [[Pythium] brassicae (nom. inval.)]
MASALAAFAYGLHGGEDPTASGPAKSAEDDAELVESEDEIPSAAKANSLVEIAQQQLETSRSLSQSLAQLAQQQQEKHDGSRSALATLAAQMNEVQAAATTTKTALRGAAELLQAQAQAQQQQAIERAVQQALLEEQQQKYQPDDDFEEEDENPAIRSAVTLLVARDRKSAGNAESNEPGSARRGTTTGGQVRSVDRQVLQQRQNRHGLESRSATKAATMKDKLSTFQFGQLSLTQRRVFLATLAGDSSSSDNNRGSGCSGSAPGAKPKKGCNMVLYASLTHQHCSGANNAYCCCDQDAINDLAKDKAKLFRQRNRSSSKKVEFAKLDDARNCRFKPRFVTGGGNQRSAQKANADDSDDDGEGNNAAQRNKDFVRRMEAAERAKNEQLRRTREENAYMARVDKKECPMCGNPQSYSELSQKRKKCPNCGVTYKNRIAWSEIADQFLERMKDYVAARADAKLQREAELAAGSAGSRRRPNNNASVDGGGDDVTWERVQDEFLDRVQLDLMQREVSRAAILRKMQLECSFAPNVSSKAKRLDLGTFDERLRRDLESRKARQEQMLAGQIATDAIAKAKARAKGSAPAKHGNFQQRLRLDLEKRREREQDNNNDNKGQGHRQRRPEQTRTK